MYDIWSKLSIPDHIVEFQNKGYHVLINPDNACSIKLNNVEYAAFSFLYAQRESCILNKEMPNYNSSDIHVVLMKLIRSNVFCLQKPSFPDKIPKTHIVYSDAYLGLTDSCNFRCVYCYAECGPAAIEQQTQSLLPYEKYCSIIDEVANVGYKRIYFTGGEPLLNPYVFRLARYAKGRGLLCGIVSNGSLIDESNISKFHVFDIVKISLDCHIEKINDLTRGKGAYKKIIRALNLLKEKQISLAINTVLNNYNKDVIEEFLVYIYERYHPVEHSVANHISVGRGGCDDCEIPLDDLLHYMDDIVQCKQLLTGGHIDSIVPDKLFKSYRKTHCGMAAGEIFINCVGHIYPCRMTYKDEYCLGNIFEIGLRNALDNADSIINGLSVDKLDRCKDCNIRYLCGGGCRVLHYSYSGSMEKTSPEVCKILKRQLESTILIENEIY